MSSTAAAMRRGSPRLGRSRSPTRAALLNASASLRRGNKHLKLPSGDVLEYTVSGRCRDSDPVIFLLHGVLPMPRFAHSTILSWYFCGLRDIDSQPYKLIVLTRRGYGQSSNAPDWRTWSYHQFASELVAVADAENAPKFIVVGHSSGGPNALACAALYPDRVVACGLLASDAPFPSPTNEYSDPLSFISVQALRTMCGRCCPDGLYNDFAVERRPYSFEISQIACPTLLLVGRCDWAVGTKTSEFLARVLRHSTLRVVTCAEHVSITYTSAIMEPFVCELVALAKQGTAKGRRAARSSSSVAHEDYAHRAPSPRSMRRRAHE